MKLIKAEVLGCCMGVRRAVGMAYTETARQNPAEAPVYTMGPLIHNPQVLSDLRARGVETLDEEALPKTLENAVVIIRAHGITPQLETELTARGARLVDATCPKVKASQLKVRSLREAGYHVFLAGERCHGEIIGIQGFAPGCVIVANREEAEAAAAAVAEKLFCGSGINSTKTALLAQTTISPEEYRAIGEGIARFFPQVEIIDTICGATRDRQDALKRLCAGVDAVIVAGGRDSANTRRLLAIAQAQGKPCWLAESAADIPREIAAYTTVGLSAGASTPDAVIDNIAAALQAVSP
ncbi:4-hydroxy-3-methylbut-2-enyl diphosphate reductase [Spirochaetia bacterium]|nr:4-hydroxy-3-methylbut-2-enyl diphosphate reductase [Spirochaetia bacterium]